MDSKQVYTIAAVGGGVLVLVLVLRNRQGSAGSALVGTGNQGLAQQQQATTQAQLQAMGLQYQLQATQAQEATKLSLGTAQAQAAQTLGLAYIGAHTADATLPYQYAAQGAQQQQSNQLQSAGLSALNTVLSNVLRTNAGGMGQPGGTTVYTTPAGTVQKAPYASFPGAGYSGGGATEQPMGAGIVPSGDDQSAYSADAGWDSGWENG